MKKYIPIVLLVLCIIIIGSGCFSDKAKIQQGVPVTQPSANGMPNDGAVKMSTPTTLNYAPHKPVSDNNEQAEVDNVWLYEVTRSQAKITKDISQINVNSPERAALEQLQIDTSIAIEENNKRVLSKDFWYAKQEWGLGIQQLNTYAKQELYKMNSNTSTDIDESSQKALYNSALSHINNYVQDMAGTKDTTPK